VPSLFTFRVSDPRLEGLAGISVEAARVALLDENGKLPHLAGRQQDGPLLITHWGLSGPAVLKLSAWGARWLHERGYRAGLRVSWRGERTADETQAEMLACKAAHPRQAVFRHSPFDALPGRLWQRLAAAAGIGEAVRWGNLSKAAERHLSQELTAGQYAIQGKGPFKEEFVTCGGVRLDEVDFRTMESKRQPGLFIAGEALDVDGLTGGFNFQNAWTTGWLAGRAVAEKV
jgi:predicted Rossmann fold flavoprotein